MQRIGFSTGALAYGDFNHAIHLLERTSAKAVELSALRTIELPMLLDSLPKLLPVLRDRYDYISFHAPTDFQNEEAIVQDLRIVSSFDLNIVVHPDTITDIELWKSLGSYLCIENMDSRKSSGRTAEELDFFFQKLPDAQLCFDIAHARQIDSSMTESLKIIERFGSKIAQFHISEVNSKGKHFPMSFSAIKAFEPFSEILSSAPIIIESVVNSSEIQGEIDKTSSILKYRKTINYTCTTMAWSIAAAE